MNICIIDDDDSSEDIARALFHNIKNVRIYNKFDKNIVFNIVLYLKEDNAVLDNITENTVIILIDNRIIRSDLKLRVIICGLFEKATITASSVNLADKLEFTYCIQRAVPSLSGNLIEQQEIKVISEWTRLDRLLAVITAKLICTGYTGDLIELKKT